jgi:hypothetical protein
MNRRPVKTPASRARHSPALSVGPTRRSTWRLIAVLVLAALLGLLVGVRVGLGIPLADYQRIALTDTLTDGPRVTAVLLKNDRLVFLTNSGYLSAQIDDSQVAQVFATLDSSAPAWASDYPTTGTTSTGQEQLSLFDGSGMHAIQIISPDTNTTLPRSLRSVLAALGRWSRDASSGATTFADFTVQVRAIKIATVPADATVYGLTSGLDLAMAASAGGQTIDRSSPLEHQWAVFESLVVGNQRIVRDASGAIWQVTWSLDPASIH